MKLRRRARERPAKTSKTRCHWPSFSVISLPSSFSHPDHEGKAFHLRSFRCSTICDAHTTSPSSLTLWGSRATDMQVQQRRPFQSGWIVPRLPEPPIPTRICKSRSDPWTNPHAAAVRSRVIAAIEGFPQRNARFMQGSVPAHACPPLVRISSSSEPVQCYHGQCLRFAAPAAELASRLQCTSLSIGARGPTSCV